MLRASQLFEMVGDLRWPKGSTIKPTHTRHAMHQSKETHWEYKYYPIGNQ